MTLQDKQRVIAETRRLLSSFYAHRESKEFVHDPAVDARLNRLARIADSLPEDSFHVEMQNFVATLGDRHLRYVRQRHANSVAVLPFSVARCLHNGEIIYAVSAVTGAALAAGLTRGSQISHWNGVPIAKEAARLARQLPGANDAAALAQAAKYLTLRPIGFLPPPVEDWILLTVIDDNSEKVIRCQWEYREIPNALLLGLQPKHPVQDLRSVLLNACDPVLLSIGAADAGAQDAMGGLSGRTLSYDGDSFGYIRIGSFAPEDANAFLQTFISLVEKSPPKGLIIDLRGNPGGFAPLGEQLVQMLVPGPVTASRFHFPITDQTVSLCLRSKLFHAWSVSLPELLQTAAPYTQGFPIEGTDAAYNTHGQKYFGPVAILIDALTYSTAELFTAGLKDQSLSVTVVGTDSTSGAGGANGWPHWVLRLFNPGFSVSAHHAATLGAGAVSEDLRADFWKNNVRLSENASVTVSQDNLGTLFLVRDAPATYQLRLMPWFSNLIAVYYAGDHAPVADLPDTVSLEVPVRRSTRVGPRAGIAIEDVGIIPDHHFPLTLNDVLAQDEELLPKVCRLLSAHPARSFQLDVRNGASELRQIECTTSGIDRVDLYDDSRPLASSDVADGKVTFEVRQPLGTLVAKAYSDGDLVGLRRLQLPS